MRSKTLWTPRAKQLRHEEMIDLIEAKREDKQAHEMDVLSGKQKFEASQEIQRQKGQLAVQGLANEGGLGVASTTGGFGLKRQGMMNEGQLANQGLQNQGNINVTGMREKGATLRGGTFDENVKSRNDAFTRLENLEKFKTTAGAFMQGLPGDQAEQMYKNADPFAGNVMERPQDNRFVEGKYELPLSGGPARQVSPDRWANARTNTVTPATQALPAPGALPPGVPTDLESQPQDKQDEYLLKLRQTNRPLYDLLRARTAAAINAGMN